MEKSALSSSRGFSPEISKASQHPNDALNSINNNKATKAKDMSVLNIGKMIYKNLGNSGLKVSAIALGNMINYKP